LHYEPHLALFVPDEDALLFYRKLAAFAANHLSPGGSLLVEIHESRSAQVQQCFAAYGFETATRKDMQGKARMVSGVKS
jgi:release factor glutamine methyltransferase